MKLRLCFLLVVLAAFPKAARAQGGLIDFMEGLSGPGPFNYGFAFDVRVACRTSFPTPAPAGTDPTTEWVGWLGKGTDPAPGHSRPCLTKPKTVQSYVELRYGRATTDDKSLFSDQPTELQGQAAATMFQALMMKQLDPSISVGAGIGGLWISGPNIQGKVFRPIVTPISVAVTPLKIMGSNAWWSRVLIFRFDENAVFGALNASDFNSASTSKFVAHTDMVRTFAVIFDVAAAFADKYK